jgi:protein-S-isoprenylcysteine O-methyltransferase Ste14
MAPRFRDTKTYDILVVSPLIAYYLFAAAGIVMRLRPEIGILDDHLDWPVALNALSQILGMIFLLLQVALFLVRRLPEKRAPGVVPNAVAVVGANISALFLLLPREQGSVALSLASAVLISLGTAGAIIVVSWLRGAFAILPQARKLVTRGPYAYLRHPLYLCEIVATLGLSLQFMQPLATLVLLAVAALQFARMHYEEQVLRNAFPDYAAYCARTARLIPGVY